MRIMISPRTMLLIIMFASIMLICSSATAQPPYCNDFGSVDVDEVCGFLFNEELREDNRVGSEGIALFLDSEEVGGDTNYFVRVGLNTTRVGTRTWGGGSDFIWTFNGSGSTNPSLVFSDNLSTHTGKFEVIATTPTDESNFAGTFKLYQTGFVQGDKFPGGVESTFIYEVGSEQEKGDSALYCVLSLFSDIRFN